MNKKLYLSGENGKGRFTLLNKVDFEYFSHWKWYFLKNGYVYRKPKDKMIYLHREILKPLIGFETDHINRKKLDNRRENLRMVDRSQSQWNKGEYRNNTSGVKGVDWKKRDSKWRVRIQVRNKRINVGLFDNLNNAKRVCIEYIRRLQNV